MNKTLLSKLFRILRKSTIKSSFGMDIVCKIFLLTIHYVDVEASHWFIFTRAITSFSVYAGSNSRTSGGQLASVSSGSNVSFALHIFIFFLYMFHITTAITD